MPHSSEQPKKEAMEMLWNDTETCCSRRLKENSAMNTKQQIRNALHQ